MPVPNAIKPLVKGIFIKEGRLNFEPVDPANPTNGQFQTTAAVIGFDAYADGNEPVGTYPVDLTIDPAQVIGPVTVTTLGDLLALNRQVFHAAVKQKDGLINAI